jgi:luciferase family oxidoreductase group 1
MSLALSVLDQSPIPAGSNGAVALRNSVDLARHCEALGYRRYWVAEHHAARSLAGAAPEILIALIAQATSRIRVGSGGMMLPHYSPLKVAELFSILAGLYPDRIDLGLGRAPGSDQRTAYALQRAPNDFLQMLAELLAYLHDRMPDDHPFASLSATLPGVPEQPDTWMLGSSPDSAAWAAEIGLPYCFADFINPNGAAIANYYRSAFQPSDHRPAPETSVAVWTICAETRDEAERLAVSSRMLMTLLLRGETAPVPPPEEALRFLEAQPASDTRSRRMVLGNPEEVRAGIEAVAGEYGADEVLLVNILYDHEARKRSYALAAQAFGLTLLN